MIGPLESSASFVAPPTSPKSRGFTTLAQQLRNGQATAGPALDLPAPDGSLPRSEDQAAAQARTAAEQLVSIALVQPMLKRVRESNNAAPPFGPTKGSKTFGTMLDAAYAAEMTSSTRWGLIDSVAQRMMARLNPGAQSAQRMELGTDGLGRQDAAFARE
jgi:Rod binding domain-containing protein